ncbi:hypothetical protein GCM10027059_28580 [Myceligenerans halotolerans]
MKLLSVRGAVVASTAVIALALSAGCTAAPSGAGMPADDHMSTGDMPMDGMDGGHGDGMHGGDGHAMPGEGDSADVPGGLQIAQAGYTLALENTTAEQGRDTPVSFTIDGPDAEAVTEFDVVHDKKLHLIVVRRDMTGFQHVHPVLGDDGTWRAELDLTPGEWRVFADFQATGADPLTLGADLRVPGDYEPAAKSPATWSSDVGDYEAVLDGTLAPGESSPLTISVAKDGDPVTDLQPYLGAHGHLVALREGDLAYLHVHPEQSPDDAEVAGPEIQFHASAPSPGRYHLFFDFKHDNVVRTASFVLRAQTQDGESWHGLPGLEGLEQGGHEH